MANAPERFSLKDHLFNRDPMTRLGGRLAPVIPLLTIHRFVTEVIDGTEFELVA